MAHRLLHSLVFSSVIALEGLGCALSHPAGMDPPPAPDPWPVPDPMTAAPDAGSLGGDAIVPGDTSVAEDTAPGDTGAADAGDTRFCEPGWPTTKASFCVTIDEVRVECCSTIVEDDCCIGLVE